MSTSLANAKRVRNTGGERRNERTNDSFFFSCCIQTMESYFYYSMEKCLHYSDNNTKLDSSEIFPPQSEIKRRRGKNQHQKQTDREFQARHVKRSLFFLLLVFHFFIFLIRFFHFVRCVYIICTQLYISRWFVSVSTLSLFILIGCSVTRSV